MTNRPTLEDERTIDRFLRDADAQDAGELRDVLLGLRTLAAGPPPIPSAELTALMTPAPVSLAARRRHKHRRTAIAAIVVAASMGAGTAAVAATDQGFRDKAQETITILINTVTNNPPAPAPDRPSPDPRPAPAATPVPGQGAGPSTPVKGPPEHTGQEVPTWLTPGTPPATIPGQARTENTPAPPSERENRGPEPLHASAPATRRG